tara:strand:+ start:1954 stop:2397 length:444 start_codon:yes stop_codon:yes gene_type:complete
VISAILLLSINILYSQEEVIKEKVYLYFNDSYDNCKYFSKKDKLKWFKKEGIQFNFCAKEIFLNTKNMQKDTLCLWHLKDYKITKIEELNKLEKKWRTDNEEALKKRHVLYKQLNRNAVFDVNIIEKINDKQMVIYKVIFKNEGVID